MVSELAGMRVSEKCFLQGHSNDRELKSACMSMEIDFERDYFHNSLPVGTRYFGQK